MQVFLCDRNFKIERRPPSLFLIYMNNEQRDMEMINYGHNITNVIILITHISRNFPAKLGFDSVAQKVAPLVKFSSTRIALEISIHETKESDSN